MPIAPALLLALAGTVQASADKVDICHWDADASWFHLISVSTHAVPAHMRHGDAYPSTYRYDADADGYGDPWGATDECPNAGFVAGATDCDDADPFVHPGAEEVCDGTVDDDCDGTVDEGCETAGPCPCWTAEELDEVLDREILDAWCGHIDGSYSGLIVSQTFAEVSGISGDDADWTAVYGMFLANGYLYDGTDETGMCSKDYVVEHCAGCMGASEVTVVYAEYLDLTFAEGDACADILYEAVMDAYGECTGW